MDLTKYAETLILAIATNKDAVAVKEFPSEDENEIILQAIVSEEDMPRIVGKNGKVINSIRTLLQASSYLKDNKRIKINIDSI